MAQVLVQNRVAVAAAAGCREEVQRQGITAKKQSTSIIMVVALTSPDGRYDSLYLSNYATLRIKDELSRIHGVGDVNVFGGGNYGMRVWLDPEKLKARNLTTEDVLGGDPRAERPGRRRPGRPAPVAAGPGLPVHRDAPWAG